MGLDAPGEGSGGEVRGRDGRGGEGEGMGEKGRVGERKRRGVLWSPKNP